MANILMSTSNVGLGSGASWSFINLVKYIKEFGHNPVVIVRQDGGICKELKKNNIQVHIIRQSNYNWIVPCNHIYDDYILKKMMYFVKNLDGYCCNLYAKKKINDLIRNENIDIVHLNSLTEYLCAEVAFKRKINVVWHIREFLEEDLNLTFFNKKKSYDLIEKSSKIIAVSRSVKNKYEKVLNHEIVTIYNGIPIDQYYYVHDIFNEDLINIAISGRITESKGHFELIEAIRKLIDNGYTNIKCNIFGPITDNIFYYQLNKYIDHYKLSKYITFCGYFEDVSIELRKMDILCVCSWKEAFGRVTIEGMLEGLLVIGANTGGTLELINDKENGLLYESKDAESLYNNLKFAIENKKNIKKIAEEGQEWAKVLFSDKQNASLINELYYSVLGIKYE